MDFQTFLQQLVNALSLGSLYALIAIGYTMVYGILRLINFAHGDVFMIGGYLAFYGVSTFFMPWVAGRRRCHRVDYGLWRRARTRGLPPAARLAAHLDHD